MILPSVYDYFLDLYVEDGQLSDIIQQSSDIQNFT